MNIESIGELIQLMFALVFTGVFVILGFLRR